MLLEVGILSGTIDKPVVLDNVKQLKLRRIEPAFKILTRYDERAHTAFGQLTVI